MARWRVEAGGWSRRWGARIVLAACVIVAFAACSGGGDDNAIERQPAGEGVWGGFVFASDPVHVTVTPERPSVDWGGYEGALTQHPGYRRFSTPEDLATFVDGVLGDDAPVLVPRNLPEGAQLLDAYAIVVAPDKIAQYGLEYALAGSDAHAGDGDIWILADFTTQYPLVISTLVNPQPDSLGRKQLPVERVRIGDLHTIYQPYDSPPALDRSLRNRSAISWFDGRVLRSVQTRDLSFDEQAAIVRSFKRRAK
jgi:hypothetical protein